MRFEESCTPNIEWQLNGCQRCVCTKDGEPACTPCLRQPTTKRIGNPGDVIMPVDKPCPHGFVLRANDTALKTCAPVDRLSTHRDEEVPVDQECPLPLVEGPRRLTTKVCRAPTRRECRPGTEYNLDCDICICMEDGVPACTKRNCRLAGYGDSQMCRHRLCPPDCTPVSEDSYCAYCKCGGIQKPGDIVTAMGDICPPGYSVTANLGLIQTCSPEPPSLGCQYGPYHLDECTNVCRCVGGDGYACGLKGCPPGLVSGQPLNCTDRVLLPNVEGYRVYCGQGIVKVQPRDEPCVPGTFFMDDQDSTFCECVNDGDEDCADIGY